MRATARVGHLGGLTPPVASGSTRETSLDPKTKALPLRPPLLPSGGSCPGGKRTLLGRLPRRSPIVSDRLRSPNARTSRRRPPSPTPRSAERADSPTRSLRVLRLRPAERSNTAGPRPAQPGRRAPAHANPPPEGRPPRARATPLQHATLGACPQALGLHHRVRGGAGLRRGGAPNPDVARSAPPLSSRPRSRRAPASLNFPYSVW